MVEPSQGIRQLACKALEMGAKEAKVVKVGDIVVADWVRLKCQYGCDGYGRRLTCPPYSPTPDQTRKLLKEFKWALMMRFEEEAPTVHEVTAKMEREAFLSGYHAAFGLGAGPCPFCDKCNLKECDHPDLARPAMEACGIDVFSTARRAGFKIEVMRSTSQKPSYYGLLLVE